MCGWTLNGIPASAPARSIICAKPAVVNGPPRSLVKTNGDFGSCSRWSRRSARSSSPRIGWGAGRAALDPTDVPGGRRKIDLRAFGCHGRSGTSSELFLRSKSWRVDPAFKFMGLRHGGNSEGGDAGLTDAQSRALSGHKTADMTRLYTKTTMRQRQDAARLRRDSRTKKGQMSE